MASLRFTGAGRNSIPTITRRKKGGKERRVSLVLHVFVDLIALQRCLGQFVLWRDGCGGGLEEGGGGVSAGRAEVGGWG